MKRPEIYADTRRDLAVAEGYPVDTGTLPISAETRLVAGEAEVPR